LLHLNSVRPSRIGGYFESFVVVARSRLASLAFLLVFAAPSGPLRAECNAVTVTSRGTGTKVQDAIKAAQAEWPARARQLNFRDPWTRQGKVISLACFLHPNASSYQYECTLVAQPCTN
jgi:hypothetical protein